MSITHINVVINVVITRICSTQLVPVGTGTGAVARRRFLGCVRGFLCYAINSQGSF